MADRREQIMARLLAILQGVTGLVSAKRNQPTIADAARPAALLVDGDETPIDGEGARRGRKGREPRIMYMTVPIVIFAEADAEDVGTTMNTLRSRIWYAIATDAALKALETEAQYLGLATSFASNRQVSGEMQIDIGITYILLPADLSGV
jgi:hypothetical protein